MSILVCGGAGYIGSHAVAELIGRGGKAVVLDNLVKGHRNAIHPDAVFYEGDLRDDDVLDKVFQENEIKAVIDFGAYSLVGESMTKPLDYYDNNLYGTMCLLRSMLKHSIRYIVFSSTAAVYGEPGTIPIPETEITAPTNVYGETKLAVEKMLKWFDTAYGIKYAALRYFNVAGAHESGELGEDHEPETHLIPLVLQAALGQRECIEIYGTDYPTADGTCIRDYIHVMDLADAHILALDKLIKDNESAVYNLGNGKGFSVRQIIETAEKVTGKTIPVKIAPRRAGDPSVLVASSDKIVRELGWTPQFSSLERIIASAWRWHSGHPRGYEG